MAATHKFNYVVTAQKPTAVRHSAVGCFTAPGVLNLIVSKCTRLEICVIGEEGLEGVFDVPVYGRISQLRLFSVDGEDTERLFMLTEKFQVAVLKFDPAQGELVTCANGDVSERVGRPVQAGQMCTISPRNDVIALHLYDGHIKIIPIKPGGILGEAFNIRVNELALLDIAFLESKEANILGVLFEDYGGRRSFTRYTLVDDGLVGASEDQDQNVTVGEVANLIIPVGGTSGALIPGASSILYTEGQESELSAALPTTIIKSYGVIDHDSGRYLLGDFRGALFLVIVEKQDGRPKALHVEQLGQTSQASTIAYLDSGIVFIGSSTADSQLIRLHSTPPDPSEPDNYVEILDTTTSLAPIVDFTVVDMDRQGQGQLVTCSGSGWDGSLRIVRSGVGVIEQATVDLPELQDVWSLRSSFYAEHDLYLVLGFAAGTRFLGLNAAEELEEVEIPGLNSQEHTLLCTNLLGTTLCQVMRSGIVLADAASGQQLDRWSVPQDGSSITLASANASQVAVVVGTSTVVLLTVEGGKIKDSDAKLDLMAEISCININPFDEGATSSDWLVVGDWSMNLLLYSVPDLELVVQESLGGDVIPRSVLMARLGGQPYVFSGLGDGHLINYRLEGTKLVDKKKLALGTKPIRLRTFRIHGETHVFCPSDRPTIIHASNQKLSYSNLNENEVTSMTSFHTAAFPDSLAIGKGDALTIGTIDRIQKLHVRTVPLGEQPRRIAHNESAKTFAVITTKATMTGGQPGTDSVRLLSEQTFETLDRFTLDPFEMACSLLSTSLGKDAQRVFYIVGTAMVRPEERESEKGRILVFEVDREKLRLVYSHPTQGAVYALAPLTVDNETYLLAGINSRVQVFSWMAEDDGRVALHPEGASACSVLALYLDTKNDVVLVGDLMKSMQILRFVPEVKGLAVQARDFRPMWITAVKMLDEETYLGAENSCNLLTLSRNSESARDDEAGRLESVGLFHLGEFVNRFQSGSLVMKLPDSELSQVPMTLFGTINGVIGLVASLPQAQFMFLDQLQNAMRKVVKGVGGFGHAKWRAFSNQYMPSGNSTGFVDGDLIEQFLDLRREEQLAVVEHLEDRRNVEDVLHLVEELSRLH